ncbi:MAG TPA: hypothetical protein VG942_19230 [Hyphomonadaceae bacterium]|nr:hypothetical protein [Hyphomonadaceae bacterium]
MNRPFQGSAAPSRYENPQKRLDRNGRPADDSAIMIKMVAVLAAGCAGLALLVAGFMTIDALLFHTAAWRQGPMRRQGFKNE